MKNWSEFFHKKAKRGLIYFKIYYQLFIITTWMHQCLEGLRRMVFLRLLDVNMFDYSFIKIFHQKSFEHKLIKYLFIVQKVNMRRFRI